MCSADATTGGAAEASEAAGAAGGGTYIAAAAELYAARFSSIITPARMMIQGQLYSHRSQCRSFSTRKHAKEHQPDGRLQRAQQSQSVTSRSVIAEALSPVSVISRKKSQIARIRSAAIRRRFLAET